MSEISRADTLAEKVDDIEKSNFNPQMLKACQDTAYDCGYQQGKSERRYLVKEDGSIHNLDEDIERAYQQGRADALDHCEKCESEQWDALYKMEVRGKIKGIDELEMALLDKFTEYDLRGFNVHNNEQIRNKVKEIAEQLKEQKNE